MLALYLVTLGTSAGLVGAFAHQVLAELGFAPSFQTGVLITGVAVFTYVSVQLFFMGLLKMTWPTRDTALYLSEMASNLSALLLLPFLMQMKMDRADTAMDRYEPLFYAAAFVLLHGVFKLISCYTAYKGKRVPRWGSTGWLVAGVLLAATSYGAGWSWWEATQNNRPQFRDVLRHYQAGPETHSTEGEAPAAISTD